MLRRRLSYCSARNERPEVSSAEQEEQFTALLASQEALSPHLRFATYTPIPPTRLRLHGAVELTEALPWRLFYANVSKVGGFLFPAFAE